MLAYVIAICSHIEATPDWDKCVMRIPPKTISTLVDCEAAITKLPPPPATRVPGEGPPVWRCIKQESSE
jgi:hypothetical protein